MAYLQPDAGSIELNSTIIKGPLEQLIPGNKGIAYLSQHFELRNNYVVKDLLDVFNKVDDVKANNIYKACDIIHLLDRRTNELSGGEKQRICIAIALAEDPVILLLDEPFSNADNLHKLKLKEVISEINELLQITIIVVSHEATDLLSWVDELIVLDKGKLIQKGTVNEVYYKPCNTLVAGLLGEYNLITKGSFFWNAYLHIQTKTNKIIIRPNQLKFTRPSLDSVKGEVMAYAFNGHYGLCSILVGEEMIIVSVLGDTYKKGQTVMICPVENFQYSIIEQTT